MKLNHSVVKDLSKVMQQVSDNSGNKGYEMSSLDWVNNNSSSSKNKLFCNLRMRDDNSNWKSVC